MNVGLAVPSDIPSWLEIVHEVEPLFGPLPGFQTILAKNIDRGRAVVVREVDGSVLAGALLGAGEGRGVVAWLAVRADARSRGVGRVLLADVLGRFPPGEDVVVDTFGDDHPGGAPARGLYASAGFVKVQRLPPGPDGGSRERWLLSGTKRSVPRLRPSARALIVDDDERVLLCKFDLPAQQVSVWTAPGGGVEPGESPRQALRRELDEELGLALVEEPAHVWHERIVAGGHVRGYDGVINEYYLIKTQHFEPDGSQGGAGLREEQITGFRWWTLSELQSYRGTAVFGPPDLAARIAQLLETGAPATPLPLFQADRQFG